MNIETIIENMEHRIKTNNFGDSTNIYKIIKHEETHRRIIELALALGEDRFLKHIESLYLDKDFTFSDGHCIRCYTNIRSSDFFREVYQEIVSNDECMTNMIVYGDVNIYIDLTHKEIPGKYKYRVYVPQINFSTPDKIIKITEGIISHIYQKGYRELKVEAI